MTERTDEAQPLEDVEDEIREELQTQRNGELTQTFLQEQAETAEITVNPQFGTWNAEQSQVVPEDPLGDASAPPGEEGASEGAAPAPTP